MKNTVGIIINSPNQKDLIKMASHRSIHAVPFGGKYRLIDFPLSNFVNSGIRDIGVIGTHKYRSLVDHLGTGQEWNLSKKSNDLAILHGGRNTRVGEIMRINLQDFVDNISFFKKIPSSTTEIVISGCNIISNFDFNDALEFHRNNDSDITMIYKNDYVGEILNKEVMLKLSGNRVIEVDSMGSENIDYNSLFVDMLIIKKELLINIIEGIYDSVNLDLIDIISENINNLNIFGYELKGYVKIINSVKSYFDCSLEMLNPSIMEEIFQNEKKIFTKVKDNHPAKYSPDSKVKNSLIASGAKIYGTVENSIVFREAVVEKGAKLSNCIVMQQSVVSENTVLVNAILDKYVKVTRDKILVSTEKQPLVIQKDTVM